MRTTAAVLVVVLSSCGFDDDSDPGIDPGGGDPADPGDVGDAGDPGTPEPADESSTPPTEFAIGVGDMVRVCNATALNQRSGPGTTYAVLRSMPSGSTTKVLAIQNGWYRNDWGGLIGWSSGTYLCPLDATQGSFDVTAITPDSFISIGKAATGFSYWWGGGRFATGAPHGSCTGTCGNCTHSGSYGADCSGFIGKAWLLPASLPMDSNKHPYSTASFNGAHSLWDDVARSSTRRGDAMVYRSGGAGHIVLYEKDDPWGSFWSYEARGCSYGVVHNVRTASSSYKSIRRTGQQ